MALKALLFDCDGVIAETEVHGHRVAFNRAFAREGIDLHWSIEEYGRLVAIGGGKERLSAAFYAQPDQFPPKVLTAAYIERLHKLKTGIFMELAASLPARPGVRRLMREAAAAGIYVCICSTAHERSVAAIARALLGRDMDSVIRRIFAGDAVKAKKPAPDIYRIAAEACGISAEECLVIEDSHIGLLAATAAGMKCVITLSAYGREDDFSEALAVVECLGDEKNPASPLTGFSPDLQQVTLNALR
ncbi:MAG: HAD-IA family hydrolase, partial [Clostridiales bacterium]|nr:HAD-IA family hydrolase [Clostridiales bacterium]